MIVKTSCVRLFLLTNSLSRTEKETYENKEGWVGGGIPSD